MKRKLLSTLLAMLICISIIPVQALAYTGNIPQISFGETINGTKENDDIYYTFETSSSGTIDLTFTGGMNNIMIFIENVNEKTVWSESKQKDRITGQITIVNSINLNAGTYYLRLTQLGSRDEGSYNLKLDYTAAQESFPESQDVNNNSIANASKISLEQTYNGFFTRNDEKDFYELTLQQDCTLTIFLEFDDSYLKLLIYDGLGTRKAGSEFSTPKAKNTFDLAAGTYYICVSSNWDRGRGAYTISASSSAENPTTPPTTPPETTPPTTPPETTPPTTPPQSVTFSDVPASHWAHSYVEKAAANALVAGMGNGLFSPGSSVSNAEWATMLCNLMSAEKISSPEGYSWWYSQVKYAHDAGFLTGTALLSAGLDSTKANPYNADVATTAINRYDMALTIYNIATANFSANASTAGVSASIADYQIIPTQYRAAVEYCYANGFLTGVDAAGTFDGAASMTRGAAATVLCRLLDAKNA